MRNPNWQLRFVSDIAAVNPAQVPKKARTGCLRYIDIAAVAEEYGGINADLVKEMDWKDAPSRARRAILSGDILVSTVRPYLRAFARVTDDFNACVASTGFAVVRAKEGEAVPGFLWALVNSGSFMSHLVSRQTGSSYPAVRPSDVEEFKFPVPDVPTQKRIAEVVEATELFAGALRSQVAHTGALRAALFNGVGTGAHVIPETYDELMAAASDS